MKKAVSLLLCLSMLFALSACGGDSAGASSQYTAEIKASADKLSSTYTNYIIATTVEFAGNTQEYIEVVKGDDIYTEYSVSEDGVLGTIPYGSSETIQYALVDWTHDNQFYSFAGTADNGDVIYKFPTNYATKYAGDREMLFVNRLLAGASNITPKDDIQVDIDGTGVATYKGYQMTVSAKTVADILSFDTQGLYLSIKDEEKSGSNISKLCDFYLEDMTGIWTYSDARVVVGVDSNMMLRFMTLEVGGLGTRMYVTKTVVATSNPNVRETPDFTTAVPLVSTMKEMADIIAQYPDHDSAVAALNTLFGE